MPMLYYGFYCSKVWVTIHLTLCFTVTIAGICMNMMPFFRYAVVSVLPIRCVCRRNSLDVLCGASMVVCVCVPASEIRGTASCAPACSWVLRAWASFPCCTWFSTTAWKTR